MSLEDLCMAKGEASKEQERIFGLGACSGTSRSSSDPMLDALHFSEHHIEDIGEAACDQSNSTISDVKAPNHLTKTSM